MTSASFGFEPLELRQRFLQAGFSGFGAASFFFGAASFFLGAASFFRDAVFCRGQTTLEAVDESFELLDQVVRTG